MQQFEYKVVPAPQRGAKARGAKTTADRFAAALMTVMNDLGRDGWEYLRADTLPCEERVGLTGKSSSFLHMLVFRRPVPSDAASGPPDLAPASPPPATRGLLRAVAPGGDGPRVTPFAKPPGPTLAGQTAGRPTTADLPTDEPARNPSPPGD